LLRTLFRQDTVSVAVFEISVFANASFGTNSRADHRLRIVTSFLAHGIALGVVFVLGSTADWSD
jgi:hypothetical protein